MYTYIVLGSIPIFLAEFNKYLLGACSYLWFTGFVVNAAFLSLASSLHCRIHLLLWGRLTNHHATPLQRTQRQATCHKKNPQIKNFTKTEREREGCTLRKERVRKVFGETQRGGIGNGRRRGSEGKALHFGGKDEPWAWARNCCHISLSLWAQSLFALMGLSLSVEARGWRINDKRWVKYHSCLSKIQVLNIFLFYFP